MLGNSNDETATASPNEQSLSADMLAKNQIANDNEVLIGKVLVQISKLKIIWYKTLKNLKLIDDFRETLSEFGILALREADNSDFNDELDSRNEEQDISHESGNIKNLPNLRKQKSSQAGFFINKLA